LGKASWFFCESLSLVVSRLATCKLKKTLLVCVPRDWTARLWLSPCSRRVALLTESEALKDWMTPMSREMEVSCTAEEGTLAAAAKAARKGP